MGTGNVADHKIRGYSDQYSGPRVQTINVGNVIVGDQISSREAMPWQEGASQKVSGSNPGKLLTV